GYEAGLHALVGRLAWRRHRRLEDSRREARDRKRGGPEGTDARRGPEAPAKKLTASFGAASARLRSLPHGPCNSRPPLRQDPSLEGKPRGRVDIASRARGRPRAGRLVAHRR